MKIHQLPNGARFEYEGEVYEKTGPLFATGKDGQRLIPKYAVLKPLGKFDSIAQAKEEDSFSRANVRKAFEAFYADCNQLVTEAQRNEMAAARDRFLSAIDLVEPK